MIYKANPFIALLILLAFQSQGQQKYCFKADEIAFNGNDLIEYYSGKLIKGKSKHKLRYDGLNLLFSSTGNRRKFQRNPKRYMPAYNGYCAIALAQGTLSRPDYNNFKIQHGKLLFFGVRAFYNMRTDWEKDPDGNKLLADKNYKAYFRKQEDKKRRP